MEGIREIFIKLSKAPLFSKAAIGEDLMTAMICEMEKMRDRIAELEGVEDDE